MALSDKCLLSAVGSPVGGGQQEREEPGGLSLPEGMDN